MSANRKAGAAALEAELLRRVASFTLSPERAVTLFCQAGLESAYGTGWPAGTMPNFNLGAIQLAKGEAWPHGTFSHKDGMPGQAKEPTLFKRYPSLSAGVDGLTRQSSRYGVGLACDHRSLLEYAAAMYRCGYFGGIVPDSYPGNLANIVHYATDLNGAKAEAVALKEAATRFAPETLTPGAAETAWRRLFGTLPILRYPSLSRDQLEALLKQHGAPALADVGRDLERAGNGANTPVVSASGNVLALILITGHQPKAGDYVTTHIGKGVFTPWVKTA